MIVRVVNNLTQLIHECRMKFNEIMYLTKHVLNFIRIDVQV